ncbi:putative RNA polymerase II transcription factor SIII, subunit A [Rosa chinensis]|uniref:Putative RNA polymerase II transcription factor SIII, subunit A n=2 Tax=Rosa chinensis TaxID=74649 RepID=A0A2P6SJG2_ROSCH|nr:putative RNA polymerase II transcription factor SIII, subunit A [Rosa chinensis]
MEKGRLIRLNDHWVSIAIDNLDSFGDVGYLDFRFLDQLLPHCSKDQLIHIEKCTKDTDLTPITDKLWKKFFERDFGGKATDEVIEKMKIKKVSFKWSELYQEKSKRLEKAEKEVGVRLKKLYEKEAARKQSRQVKVLDKVPPSSSTNNRNGSNKDSKLMSRLRKQHLNCLEMRNIQAMKMKRTAANYSGLIKRPRTTIRPMNIF